MCALEREREREREKAATTEIFHYLKKIFQKGNLGKEEEEGILFDILA